MPSRASVHDDRAHDRRRTARKALLLGLAASVLIHLLATLTFRFRIDVVTPRAPSVQLVQPSEQYAGTRLYDIVPVAGDPAPIEAQLQLRERSEPVPMAAPGEAPPSEAPVAGGTRRTVDPVGDRLRPRLGHAEVWIEPDAALPPLSEDEIMRRRLAEQLTVYNDSMRLETEREARALDWTIKDGSGNRWGISPGKIHLGSITLPAPGGGGTFNTPPARGGADDARIVNWQELHAQAQRQIVSEIFNDRVKAVRARREAERDSTRSDGR